MANLSMHDVSRTFPGGRGHAATQALCATSLEVTDNNFIAIPGASGCGKGTLPRIVAGLDVASSGQVLLDGVAVSGPGVDHGMVFQSHTLCPWLTVREHICFGLRERGVPAARQAEIAGHSIAQVGLRGFEGLFPKILSGCMQQRTARANDPTVLLIDEPLGALDHRTRGLMQELLLNIRAAHRKAALFVPHDIDEAIFMANRVVVMRARPGRIKHQEAIAFPHPRDDRIKTTPGFARHKARLTDEIRVETQPAAMAG